jgi:hypothetical protein
MSSDITGSLKPVLLFRDKNLNEVIRTAAIEIISSSTQREVAAEVAHHRCLKV